MTRNIRTITNNEQFFCIMKNAKVLGNEEL